MLRAEVQGSGPSVSTSYGSGAWARHCINVGRPTRPRRQYQARATTTPSFGESVKRVAKQVQGALPLVGLFSRLLSPSGGIGKDMLAYPEFCRATFDLAPDNFLTICTEMQKAYGKPADRRYILLYLWMAREGGGMVPSKPIMSSAKRLRVTQDMEIEIDRFEMARAQIAEKYSYMDRPRGKPQEQINVAVDALTRLVPGTGDGEAIPQPAASLIEQLVTGAWADIPEAGQMAEQAVATHPQRADDYK
ncbi:MAG: calcium homeostasis regulater C 1 [Trebouxia sp. A1-2]|nr:MAG: calcium homeostasis regulater C 1 [Trebouxia sp. A1-2]